MATKRPRRGRVVTDLGAYHAPYIPQLFQEKEPKMSLRKRFVQWLLAPDVLPYEEVDEPIKVAARRTSANWNNAISTMSNRKNAGNAAIMVKGSSSRDEPMINSSGITFKLFPARGGIVVETYHYDDKIGEDRNTLHLIAEDEELAEALARIITMEAARS